MFSDCRKPSPHFPTHHYTDAVSDNRSACLEVSQHRLYPRTSYSAPKHHPVTQHARGSGIKKLPADYILSRSLLANPLDSSSELPSIANLSQKKNIISRRTNSSTRAYLPIHFISPPKPSAANKTQNSPSEHHETKNLPVLFVLEKKNGGLAFLSHPRIGVGGKW